MASVEYIKELNTFAQFNRVEIPRTEFTYDVAVQKIIELNNEFNYDYIYVDAGHGEAQIEQLRKHGLLHPETGLHKKIVRVNFSEKVSVFDPVTRAKDKKDIKPFMVNNTVLLFERGQFAFNPDDKATIKQFEDYYVERFGMNGRPIYTEENEHIHDCIILAIHGFTMKFNDFFKVKHANYIGKIENFSKTPSDLPIRSLEEETNGVTHINGTVGLTGVSAVRYLNNVYGGRSSGTKRRSMSRPTRKSF